MTGPAGTVRLEPKVMQVLVCLAAHAGQVVTKERLMATVWPNAFVTDDVLTRSISELRRLFGDDPKNPRYIHTIPKSGYRLIARVSSDAPEQENAAPVPAALDTAPLSDDSVPAEVDAPYIPALHRGSGQTAPSNGSAAAEQVSGRRALRFRIAAAILGAGVTLVVGVALWVGWAADPPRADGHGIRSIAVLPLAACSKTSVAR